VGSSKIIYGIIILLLITSTAYTGQSVVIFDFEDIGVGSQTVRAATQVFRNEIGATGKFTVITKGDMESRLIKAEIYDFACHDVAGASLKGNAIGSDWAIIGSLTKLGGKIIAEAQLVNVDESRVDFSDRFSSESIDDLDIVLHRLAEAIANRNKVESEVNKFQLIEEETDQPRRKKSYMTSGVSFGFGFPLDDSSYSNVDNLKNLAWCMRYEAGRFVVDNSLGFSWGSAKITLDSSPNETQRKGFFIIPWDIGLRYLLAPESDLSPYVGAGLGFHFIFSAKIGGETIVEGDQAMAAHLATGLYAFQSYDFRFVFDVKYTVVFSDAFWGDNKTSQQIGISIGIARKWKSGQKRILYIF